MDRKELINYRNNQEWVKGRKEYIEEYSSTINKITSTISDMPKGSKAVQDSMAEKIAKLLDMVDDLLDKVLQVEEKQHEILNKLDSIEQPYRNILDKVYIQGKSLVRVADEMNYSYRQMCRLHGDALSQYDKL